MYAWRSLGWRSGVLGGILLFLGRLLGVRLGRANGDAARGACFEAVHARL